MEAGERGVQPDGKRIVTASCDATARLWTPKPGSKSAAAQGHRTDRRGVQLDFCALSPRRMTRQRAGTPKPAIGAPLEAMRTSV
jgi:hypothetical protein